MESKKRNTGTRILVCVSAGIIVGILFVLIIFSPRNIDPSNTDWVVNGGGDNLQHYLGWSFFRNSPWTRYLLFMRNWNYPVGTSVIVTDSNPLFCLFFKIFNVILPDTFQFNGIWILTSYVLLGAFSGLISWRLTHNYLLTLAGIIIAVLNPVVLQRAMIHDTLTAHWLILAAVWLFLNDDSRWNLPGWFILTGITLLVHIYFLPMLAFVLSLQIIRMLVKKKGAVRVISVLSVFILTVLLGYFIFGYSFIMPQSGSYGELSMNLNAFINPDGHSSFLRTRPTLPLQYEGFNYFGLGLLIMIPAALLFGMRNFPEKWLLYLVPIIVLILFAVSNHAYFDLHQVFYIKLPDRIVSMFSILRSSGRLVWPVYYLALFGSLRLLAASSNRKRIIGIVAAVCALIQFIDLKDFYAESARRFRSPDNRLSELPSGFSNLMTDNIVHLYVSDGDAKTVDALALFAAGKHLTFNKSTSARGIKPIFGGDELVMDQLTCEQIDLHSAYLYLTADYPDALNDCDTAVIEPIKDWILIRYREE